MKQSNLISILILLFSLLSIQSVVAQVRVPEDETQPGTWYVIYDTNETEKSATSSGNVKTYDNLKYPNKKTLSVDCYINGGTEKYTLNLYQTVNGNETQVDSKTISKGKKWTNGNIFSNINENTTKLRFEFNYNTYKRRIRNVFLEMAPHILLKEITGDGTKNLGTGATATSTKTATINFGSMRNNEDARTATIKIKSCLSAGNLATTLSNTSRGFSITGGVSGAGNTFVALENSNDITVTFDPKQAGVTTTTQTITETITISDDVNTGNNVVITLTATVNPPQTQTITWNQSEFNKILRIGDVIALNATASSNLGVTYTSRNTSVATVSGNKLTIVGAGIAIITASQDGNDNYQAAESVHDTITTYQYNVSNLQKEIGYNYAKLSWDNIHEADSYSIEPLGKSTTGINYTIANLTHNTTYTYKIKTNDAQSIHTQSSGTDVSIKTLEYPKVSGISITDVQPNQATISWTGVNLINNHSLVKYHIELYENNSTTPKTITTTETSIQLKDLVDTTPYKVKIGVEYQYTLDGTQYPAVKPTHGKEEQWATSNVFNTTSYIPTEGYDGVIIYQGEWHRVRVNHKDDITDKTYTFQLNYPCNTLRYEAWLSASANASHTVSNNVTTEHKSINLAEQDYSNDNRYTLPTQKIDTTYREVKITGDRHWTGDKTIYVDNIYARIAPHIVLNTPNENDLGNIEIGSTAKLVIDFKSFLTKGDLVATTSNKNFLIDGTLESKTIATGANVLEKTTDNTTFTVVFAPEKLGEDQTIITITDGTSTQTITIKGNCIKKTPIITWTKDKQMNPGTIIANAATSTCGTAITYNTANSEVIDIVNGELVAKNVGTVKITATTAGNDTYISHSSEAFFEVTNKTLQEIVWNQSFYNLKIGGNNITLDAHTINKATGIANNLPITYSTANNSVVSITNGELHIEGLGQTTITATQAGNDEYAALSKTMTVYVRPDYDDCSGEYVFADNETYTKGDATWGGFTRSTIEKEYTLTTVGDKLSFTASASAGGLTTGNGLKVTDQDGNEIFSRSASNIEGIQNLQLARSVKSLKFYINGNFQISLSNIYVTQAVYLEKEQNAISFPETMAGKTGNASISFDWANQPDVMYAAIIEDEHGVFSVEENTEIEGTYIFGGSCGDAGTNTIRLFFNPTTSGDYSAKLAVYVGETTKAKEIVTLTAKSIKQPQFITWDQELNPVQGRKYDLTATTTSSLPITYTSSDENIARIEDGKLVILGAGSVSITASQSGNEAYEAAGSVTKTFSIAKLDQTISWNQDLPAGLITGNTITLEATASSGETVIFTSSNEDVAIVVGNQLTIVGIGTTTITASQPGNNNYNAAPEIIKTLNIVRLNNTITWEQSQFNKTLRIGDTFTLNAFASSGLSITYSSSDQSIVKIEGNTLTVIRAGENITITASQNGNTNYFPAENITKTITTYQYNVSNLQATETTYKYIKLTWDAIDGADSYSIFEGNTLKGTTSETNYTITGVDYATNHTYTIKTNDAESYTPQSTGSTINVTTVDYPKTDNAWASEIKQNDATIEWSPVTVLPNHELIEYYVRIYKRENNDIKFEKEYQIDKNSNTCKIEGLLDATTYVAYVGVKYKQNLDGQVFASTDINDLKPVEIPTTSFIGNEEVIDGVKMYQGVWYRVNLNGNIEIANGHNQLMPYTMNLHYPCETFRYEAWISGNAGDYHTVIVKDDKNNTIDEKQLNYTIAEGGYLENNKYKFETKNFSDQISSLKFDPSIGSTGGKTIYIKNMGAKIIPHILLNNTKYITIEENTTTQTTKAVVDFGSIEIGTSKPVNIDFKSFLSKGEIKARLTDETNSDIFWLNSVRGTKEHNIAGDNEIEEIYTNDNSFSISFNPTVASEEEYTGTLIIEDDLHTVTLELKAKCIKKTPEITWINDKYISLGEYLAGAASSTSGTIQYNSNNNDAITIDGNLLYANTIDSAVITASIPEDETHYAVNTTATFTVTDKIIQTIEWNDDLSALTENSDLNFTAQAITRITGEPNGNQITYSSSNVNIIDIIDGKPEIKGSGFTYITAHQKGNDEYAPTYMTKLAFIRKTNNDCENYLALDHEGGSWGDWTTGFKWGPYSFSADLETIGDDMTFKTGTPSGAATTGDKIIITDNLGNVVYESSLSDGTNTEKNHSVEDKISPDATSLTFTLYGNFNIYISDIKVTPAKYITPDKTKIEFQGTEVNFKAIEEVDFEWANQSDYIWAKIIDDTEGVFAVDSKTAIFGSPTCGEYGTSTVKVIFSPKEEKEYTANLAIYVGGNTTDPLKTIPIIGQGYKAQQKIYWLNVTDLTTADKEINLAKTTASSPQPITYTIVSDANNVVKINEDSTLTIVGEGTFKLKAQQEGNNSYLPSGTTEEKEFTATIGNLIFDNRGNDNVWNNIENWKPESKLNLRRNISPEENVNLSITTSSTVGNNTTITNQNTTTIENGGSITIAPKGTLRVNTINGTTDKNLTLESSADGNAAFTFLSGTPSATVEMHSKAEYGTTDTDGHHPEWQYMGVAVNDAKVSDFKYDDSRNAWLLKWEEKDNVTGDPWTDAPLAAGTDLEAWAGYSISQPTAKTYSMKGALMNGNHTYTLTRTTREGDTQDPDCGFNLLANSYTAPIDITKLEADSFKNADACIVLYNTGTYADWESQTGKSGEAPGQLTVIPIEAAKAIAGDGLPTTIASMQAFFVMTKEGGGSFTVDYETAVAGASNHGNQMRAPEAQDEFNVLKIMIKGENSRDQLFLLENENTSKAYDNGYEARKIFDAPRGHQMYATCEYGYASIDCSKSFIGQAIGLKGDNEGEKLTISFGIDKIGDHESLFLYDKATGEYVNIMAEEEYTFYGIRGADDNRFCIVTNPDDRNQTPPFVVIGDELAFDKSQIGTDNANIYIYDTLGRLLMTDKVNPGENYRIPDMPEGIYLVNMNGYTTKIVRK